MAVATDLVQGTIVLSGDLQGNENGNGPELTPTGVVAGTYYLPDFVVGPDGRILYMVDVPGSVPSDGLSFASQVPNTTTSSKGVMQVGSGLAVTSGVVSVDAIVIPDATEGSKGAIQVGNGLDVTAGVVSVDFTEAPVPDATTSTKGIMQVGNGLDAAAGVVSVNTSEFSFPDTTESSKGLMRVGSGLNVASGVVSIAGYTIPDATTSTKGIMQAGNGLDVTAGVVSVDFTELSPADTTTSSKGVMQVGNYLNVTAGVVNADLAENATAGVVYSNDTDHITISSGLIDTGATVALNDTKNIFTAGLLSQPNTLTFSASITPDFSLSNVYNLTLTGNTTLNAPTNPGEGAVYIIIIKQDATGGRTVTFDSTFKFTSAPTITPSSNAVDIVTMTYWSTVGFLCTLTQDYS